jgi:alpha-L-fucosidase
MTRDDVTGGEDRLAWFRAARHGMFIHWGPYAAIGRGEQVLYREHLDQAAYERDACTWNPQGFDAQAWADAAVRGGFRYAVLTTRHHDGYCLWDSKQTDYTSMSQAPRRDFVREYVEAFRERGLRVGLYYSLADWRLPAYWRGPELDPRGFDAMRRYVYAQVEELCRDYGRIDVLWFDGSWPHSAKRWGSAEFIARARALQPHILINNRVGRDETEGGHANANESAVLGDFGTPEHHIAAEKARPWESCRTTTWRLWGYTRGERWHDADMLLDWLCQATQLGGNLLLNVGPDGHGRLPPQFIDRSAAIGDWLKVHSEAIDAHDHAGRTLTESVSYGYQTIRGNDLYLILRFWPGEPELRLADLASAVQEVVLLTTGQSLPFAKQGETLVIRGLPERAPIDLFPVIRVRCEGPPRGGAWASLRLWGGDPAARAAWAAARGSTPFVGR